MAYGTYVKCRCGICNIVKKGPEMYCACGGCGIDICEDCLINEGCIKDEIGIIYCPACAKNYHASPIMDTVDISTMDHDTDANAGDDAMNVIELLILRYKTKPKYVGRRHKTIHITNSEITELEAMQARLSELESENARLRAMAEWQPITEAPRDGTQIEIVYKHEFLKERLYAIVESRRINTKNRQWKISFDPDYLVEEKDILGFRLLPPPPEK